MADVAIVEHLPWDSAHFGFPIGRMDTSGTSAQDPAQLRHALASSGARCVYLRLGVADIAGVELAQRAEFKIVDLRHTLGRAIGEGPELGKGGQMPSAVRELQRTEIDEVTSLARGSFTASRFFSDPQFERTRSEALFARWAERACLNPLGTVFIAEHAGDVAGFVSCQTDGSQEGSIGLICVGPAADGQGLGGALVGRALEWLQAHGKLHARVVTQGRNTAAQRMYQRHGFLTESMDIWLHWWSQDSRDAHR